MLATSKNNISSRSIKAGVVSIGSETSSLSDTSRMGFVGSSPIGADPKDRFDNVND